MNEDKLKELEQWLEDADIYADADFEQRVTDLITAYRQLQKDNANLIASNQERAKGLTTMLAREKEFREAKTDNKGD